MRLLSSITILSLPFTIAYNHHPPLQVYLHPTPTDQSHLSAPTLSADQAKAVLSHHLGEGIGDFEEIPADEGLWGHWMGMWNGIGGGVGGGAGHGGMYKGVGMKEGEQPRVVIIDGGVSSQEILPSSLPQSPSFYLAEESSTRALLAPYLQRASHLLDIVLDSIPAFAHRFKDIFDLAGSRAAAALGKELSCLTALADSFPFIDHSPHAYPWEAITISGLGQVDRKEEVWETGRKGLQAGLEAMTQPNSPPLLLIIVPSQNTNLRRALPIIPNPISLLAANPPSEACYSSNETCSSSTTCSGRGSCFLKSKKAGGEECWGCKCVSGYAGVSCQKADYSMPFVILIFSSILLMATLGGSIALLWSVGETKLPSTLNLAVGGGTMKRD